jgi:hypothetical protein
MSSNMKTLVIRCFIAFLFLIGVSFAFAGGFKSKIITSTSSPLVITVPDDRFLRITNFSQEGGTDRGVVTVTLSGETGGTANVLTATRIDFSSGSNSQNFPEINNEVRIAGPAEVRVAPVSGATLFVTYRKRSNEGAGEPNTVVVVTPTPAATATPTAAANPGS